MMFDFRRNLDAAERLAGGRVMIWKRLAIWTPVLVALVPVVLAASLGLLPVGRFALAVVLGGAVTALTAMLIAFRRRPTLLIAARADQYEAALGLASRLRQSVVPGVRVEIVDDDPAHNVAMADRWRQLADNECRITRCTECRDALTADELRNGLTVCLCCQPDRLACPSCHEPTVDGRFCGVCLSSSPVGVDASLRGTGSVVCADPDGSVAPVDAVPPVSRATDPQPESEGL